MRIEDIQLKESILSKLAFGATVTVIVLSIFGYADYKSILVALSFYIVSILLRLEKNFDEREISHETITVQRGDGVWVFRIANYKVYVDRKRAEEISRFLQTTVNPTSDWKT